MAPWRLCRAVGRVAIEIGAWPDPRLASRLPTAVFFLAKMRMVTARFLAVNIKYAILISFIVAAVLTPDGSPWNQTLFAVPMIGLYAV